MGESLLQSFIAASKLCRWLARLDAPIFIKECKTLFDKAFGSKFRELTVFEDVSVVEHGVYPVFYSVFPLFLPILLSPPEAFLVFDQSKRPSQRLTMCALPSFFLTPIRRPGIPVVYRLL
jgi:hypothetical protein